MTVDRAEGSQNNDPGSPSIEQIRRARKNAGLTQAEAAALLYRSGHGWQQWEAGTNRMDPALWEYWLIQAGVRKEADKPTPDQVYYARIRVGLNQAEAAQLVYRTRQHWHQWEKGMCRMDAALWEFWKLRAGFIQLLLDEPVEDET